MSRVSGCRSVESSLGSRLSAPVEAGRACQRSAADDLVGRQEHYRKRDRVKDEQQTKDSAHDKLSSSQLILTARLQTIPLLKRVMHK